MWQPVKLSDVSFGPRYSLVVDEDVAKPSKQTAMRLDGGNRLTSRNEGEHGVKQECGLSLELFYDYEIH